MHKSDSVALRTAFPSIDIGPGSSNWSKHKLTYQFYWNMTSLCLSHYVNEWLSSSPPMDCMTLLVHHDSCWHWMRGLISWILSSWSVIKVYGCLPDKNTATIKTRVLITVTSLGNTWVDHPSSITALICCIFFLIMTSLRNKWCMNTDLLSTTSLDFLQLIISTLFPVVFCQFHLKKWQKQIQF